jgi:protease-4
MNNNPDNDAPPRLQNSGENPPPHNPSRRQSGWWIIGLAVLMLFCLIGYGLIQMMGQISGSFRPPEPGVEKYQEIQMRQGNNVARIVVIRIEGVISSYSFDGSGQSMVTRVRDQLKLAALDDTVRAVLLKVDSPGGEVMASNEIHQLIEKFTADTGHPVICSMAGLAASGGYYVAAPCEFIVANELTITGSIGVIMQTVNIHGLLEKIGARPYTITSGKNKDSLSSFKDPAEIEADNDEELYRELITFYFDRFKNIVKEGRKASQEFNKTKADKGRPLAADWAKLADGRVLTGVKAHEKGFVDKLGNFDVAVRETERIIGLSKNETAYLIRYAAPFDLSGLLRFFVKTEPPNLKVDLGIKVPRLDPGRPYYLSPVFYK